MQWNFCFSPVKCDKNEHAISVNTLVSEDRLKWMRKLARASYSCNSDLTTATSPKTSRSSKITSAGSKKEKGEEDENAETKSGYFSVKLRHQFDIELAAYLSMVSCMDEIPGLSHILWRYC